MHVHKTTYAVQVEEEVDLLRRYKAKHLGRSAVGLQLDAWDRLFYMRVAQVQQELLYKLPAALSSGMGPPCKQGHIIHLHLVLLHHTP